MNTSMEVPRRNLNNGSNIEQQEKPSQFPYEMFVDFNNKLWMHISNKHPWLNHHVLVSILAPSDGISAINRIMSIVGFKSLN